MKCFALVVIIGFILPGRSFAGSPFMVTESAIPVAPNKYRADASLRFEEFQQGLRHNKLSFSMRYGLIHNLEVQATLPYLFSKKNARHADQLGDLNLAAKVLFLKGRDASPLSLASGVQIKIPSAPRDLKIVNTTGEPDIRLSFMASKAVARYKAHLNLAHTYVGNSPHEERSDRRDYAVGVEYAAPRPNLSFMGEIFGAADVTGPSAHEQWSLAGGASYRISPLVRLDGSVAFGLSNPAPDFIIHLKLGYAF